MNIKQALFLSINLLSALLSLATASFTEQFKQVGYVEMCNTTHGTSTFDVLYVYFDELIYAF